tara:strand:- start:405 stop:3158 length:2754 start_codon:yes stop_codon:yes gene_type:complete
MKKFLGFTPDQASKMLQQKGLKANSREGAEFLAGMHKKAETMLADTGYQYGGQVGGFDDQSTKLFDAAIKRTSSTEPKSPEVQRYLDNVIQTRGRPTMVYPTTADPLTGYDNGGDVRDLAQDNQLKRSLLAERVKENVNFGADRSTYDLIEKIPFLGRIAEDYYLKLLANQLDSKIGREDMPYSNRLLMAGKNAQADNDLYKELLSYADEEFPQGTQEPKEEIPLYRKKMQEEVTRKNKELMQGQSEDQKLYDQSTKEIERQRELERQEFNERRRKEYMERQGFQEGGSVTAPAETKTKLNQAQSQLAKAQGDLSDLQQQLAALPTDASQDAKRQEIVDKITGQQTKITQAEAAVASASQAFQVAAIPTTAEAVGATVSTPEDLVTGQDVSKIIEGTKQIIDKGTGEVGDRTDKTAQEGTTAQATASTQPTLTKATTEDVTQDVRDEALTKTTGKLTDDAQVKAQEIEQNELAVRDVKAAQIGEGVQVVSPAKRKLEQGEVFSGVANAEVAKNFLEGVEAATGAPSSQATVQGQLTSLMTQFEGGEPPAWAAGAMRQATAVMAQRGLAASSMAGQAIVQAAMESALPIALQDAQTVARFEEQNLSNRQQRAILAAQQRAQFLGMEFDQEFQARVAKAATISDIANRNFSAEVQIALENSRLAQTTNLTNVGNRQAVVMAQAAAIAEADMTNLNNRQQAAVRNAQHFLQMDMANFNAEQQVDMFKNQSVIQGLFTDQAAQNAMEQFNATSQNQSDQFFARLETQVSESNTAQSNAMEQFNAGEVNALTKFQEQLNNQRDLFNAQNQLVIAQANAQWRQQLATINNAAQNEANRQDALQANGLTQKGLDEIWQRERDLMAYAFTSAENAQSRRVELLKQELQNDTASDSAFSTALGGFAGAVVNGIFGMYEGYYANKGT